MDIQVGDKVTYKYKYDNEKIEEIMIDMDYVENLKEDVDIEILKIERPSYEVVEEKKELLTDEERDFLKGFINIKSDKILYIQRRNTSIVIVGKQWADSVLTNKFQNLEKGKQYTLKDLGLEVEDE